MRAEEIIAELWRQMREMRAGGKNPAKIILSPEQCRHVWAWHIALGELKDPSQDYITRDSIFGLPVFIEENAAPKVAEKI